MKIAVLLSGSGVFDGSEIHEAVFTLLAIKELGHSYQCYAPDVPQHHVVNHLTGEEMAEERNVLIESARIARGDCKPLSAFDANAVQALLIPGGFGAAKNLNQWALAGPEGSINSEVKAAILSMLAAKKPIGALCMGPTVVAKALEGTNYRAALSVGSTESPSPYDIEGISKGMESIGAVAVMRIKDEISVDTTNNLVCGPCYMMESDIVTVYKNAFDVVKKVVELLA